MSSLALVSLLCALHWASASPVCSEYGPLQASSLGGRSLGCLDTEEASSFLGEPHLFLAKCDPGRWSQWWSAVPTPGGGGKIRLVQARAPHVFPAEPPTGAPGRRLASLPSLARRFGMVSKPPVLTPDTTDLQCLEVAAGSTSRCGKADAAERLTLELDERGWLCDGYSRRCLHLEGYLELLPTTPKMLGGPERQRVQPGPRWLKIVGKQTRHDDERTGAGEEGEERPATRARALR